MAEVLIIDDERLVRQLMCDLLIAAGHTVREAHDGQSGLAALRARVPDLVVCDLFMPGMEGIETVREMRRLVPALPIIVVSGGGRFGLLGSLEDAAALGATLALPKPISRGMLLQAIGELLDGLPGSQPCSEALLRDTCGHLCPNLHSCPRSGSSVWCGARGREHSPQAQALGPHEVGR